MLRSLRVARAKERKTESQTSHFASYGGKFDDIWKQYHHACARIGDMVIGYSIAANTTFTAGLDLLYTHRSLLVHRSKVFMPLRAALVLIRIVQPKQK